MDKTSGVAGLDEHWLPKHVLIALAKRMFKTGVFIRKDYQFASCRELLACANAHVRVGFFSHVR